MSTLTRPDLPSGTDHGAETSLVPPLVPNDTPHEFTGPVIPHDVQNELAGGNVGPKRLLLLPSAASEEDQLSQADTASPLRVKLITGIVALAALTALAYFLIPLAADKQPKPPSDRSTGLQSPPAAPGGETKSAQLPTPSSEPSNPPSSGPLVQPPAEPAVAPKDTRIEAPPQIAPTGPQADDAAMASPEGGPERWGVLFLQRSGVNLRSAPSLKARTLGIPAKGTRFQVINREVDWVQVESGRLKGWINGRFLAADQPR
jgi:hypothetical protein